MKIEGIREFIVFARYLNVTRAAKELHYSQPVLSTHLAALEKELGFTLFERTDSPRLTPEGSAFLEDAEELLQHYEATLKRCMEIHKARIASEHVLRIESPVASASLEKAVNRLLLDFEAQVKNVHCSTSVSDTKDLFELLQIGEIDVGFVYGEPSWGDSTRVFEGYGLMPLPVKERSRQYVWVDSDDPLAQKDSLNLQDLDGRSVRIPIGVRYKPFDELVKAFCERIAQKGVRIAVKHSVGNLDEITLRTKNDEIGIVDEADLDTPRYASFKNRTFVLLDDTAFAMRLYLIYKEENQNSCLQQFLAFTRDLNERGIVVG